MKTVILTNSVSRADGGIFEVTRRGAQSLAAQPGLNVEVLALEDDFTQTDLPQWTPLHPKTFRRRGPRVCGYAPRLAEALGKSNADVLHMHGLWGYYTLDGYNWSRHHSRPFLLTVHGMLSSCALTVSRWKKLAGGPLFRNTVLRGARCVQAFTEREMADLRSYGLRNPVCVIPNGIDLPCEKPVAPPPWCERVEPGGKVMLYLGRLHPIKGLPNLIDAWQIFRRDHAPEAKDWSLVIAGWGQGGHEKELQARAQAAGLSKSVHFLGPQYGEAKAAAFHNADAVVLPSHSEGLPTVLLEAWANRLPVLMTPECSLAEGYQSSAAVRIETTPASIAEGLGRMASLTDAERRAMGERGRDLVAERFTWPKVVSDLRSVYEWMLNKGEAPACVNFN